jgi:hypothetical protein
MPGGLGQTKDHMIEWGSLLLGSGSGREAAKMVEFGGGEWCGQGNEKRWLMEMTVEHRLPRNWFTVPELLVSCSAVGEWWKNSEPFLFLTFFGCGFVSLYVKRRKINHFYKL